MRQLYLSVVVALVVTAMVGCATTPSAVPTSLPTVAPQPGWHLLEKDGFQIWVPQSFIGGTQLNMDALLPTLRQFGPDYARAAESIKQQGLSLVVFAVDTKRGYPGLTTNMLVEKVPIDSTVGIGEFTDGLAKGVLSLSTGYELLAKEWRSTDRYPVGRILVRTTAMNSSSVTQELYAVQHGGAVWQIAFTTPSSEFDERSAVFERISSSATLPYTPPTAPRTGSPVVMLIGLGLVALAFILRAFVKPRNKGMPTPASGQSTAGANAEVQPAALMAPAPKKRVAARKTGASKTARKTEAVPRKGARSGTRKKPRPAKRR